LFCSLGASINKIFALLPFNIFKKGGETLMMIFFFSKKTYSILEDEMMFNE